MQPFNDVRVGARRLRPVRPHATNERRTRYPPASRTVEASQPHLVDPVVAGQLGVEHREQVGALAAEHRSPVPGRQHVDTGQPLLRLHLNRFWGTIMTPVPSLYFDPHGPIQEICGG